MKKVEIESIVKQNKRRRTETLKNIINDLNQVVADREVTRGMWFWTDNGNLYQRSEKEDRYYRNVEIKLNGLTIRYRRNISMSRKNVYAKEVLEGIRNEQVITITCRDLQKIIDGFESIVETRTGIA